MSRFAKTEKLLSSLAESHDMNAASANAGSAKRLVLVQAKDAAGFWVNVGEPASVAIGKQVAAMYHAEHQGVVRVCVGPKRDVVWSVGDVQQRRQGA